MMREGLSEEEQAGRLHWLGVFGVFALWLPIFIWMAHLASMAALAVYISNHPGKWWSAWVDTGICAAAVIVCMITAVAIGISMNAREDEGNAQGRNRFLAWQAILAGFANLALILAEGSTILFLSAAVR